MCPSAGLPGNWWAHLLSIPPITGSLPIPPRVKNAATAAAAFCLPSSVYSGMSLQDHFASDVKDLPSIKPLMSLSLTLGSFFSPEAEQAQGLQAWEVQPNSFCRVVCWPDLMIHLWVFPRLMHTCQALMRPWGHWNSNVNTQILEEFLTGVPLEGRGNEHGPVHLC